MFKRGIVIAIFALWLEMQVSDCEQLGLYAYKLDCGETVFPATNETCILKVVGRGQSVITLTAIMLEKMYFIRVNVAVIWKTSANLFNQVILNNTLEMCEGMKNIPPLYKMVLPLIDKYAPGAIHECPYYGKVGVENLKIDTSLIPVLALSTFSRGEYRIDITFYDKRAVKFFWNRIYVQVTAKKFSKLNKNKDKNATETPT